MIKARKPPLGWRRMPGGGEENGKIPVAYLVNRQLEGIHPNGMHREFVIAPPLAPHQEFSTWNQCADGLDEVRKGLIEVCILVSQRRYRENTFVRT